MNNKFHYAKELRWLPLSTLTIIPEYRIYKARERTDLEDTLKESGVIQPFTALENDLPLIDGFDRHDTLTKLNDPEMIVPVWVITENITPIQIKKLILDLSRHKQKTNIDYIAEFEIYNSIIPNEQGKKIDGPNRHAVIAGLMGISTSQLSKLLRINSIKPMLLQEVDNGHRTLSDAEQMVKEINRQLPENNKTRELNFAKPIEITKSDNVCPTCKRPFGNMEWKDIPSFFTFNRDETNNQTDWLEPINETTTNPEIIIKNDGE